MSLKHHPDKGGDAQQFKLVSRAYEILSDGDKRGLYDVGGFEAVEKGVGGTDPWGRPVGIQRGKEVAVSVRVPLEDMYKGGTVRVKVRRREVCRGCGIGRRPMPGASGADRCEGCSASCPSELKTVRIRRGNMIMQQQREEPSRERCKEAVKTLLAHIEKGAVDGDDITFPRAGEQTPGQLPGSVIVRIKAARHAVFTREGNDLRMKLKISLRQALLGFERTIRHLDGHTVTVSSTSISRPGQVIALAGEGMPVRGTADEHGYLRVDLIVKMPKRLTDEERAFVATHFEPGADEGGSPEAETRR